MRLFLTRHGETVENKQGIIQGHLPGQLTDLGKEQATKLAERLKDERFDIIYASDLARVEDTVEEIAKYHQGTTLCLSKALRERNFGDHQGKTKAEVWDEDNLHYHEHVGGETPEEFYERVNAFWEEIKEKHADQNVLCVSHDGTTTALVAAITTGSITGMRGQKHFGNTSLSVITVDDEGHDIELTNDMSHLSPIT
ncbi:histidine phosphatase family protein [Candidatus Woesearchaeota archaeon]|nr:histidine phosphatase family protein [Candidatus Woesearchaeota archaeon]